MIRTFLEFQIQRALDESSTLPAWLRVLLRYDPRLRHFADQSQQLDERLRAGARTRHESLFETTSERSQVELSPRPDFPRHRTLIVRLTTAALAASLAVGFFVHRTSERQANAEHARFLSQQLTTVPEEMATMLTLAVNRSQAELPRYNPLAQLKLPETNLLADLSLRTQARLESQVESIISPWQSMGSQLVSQWNRIPSAKPD